MTNELDRRRVLQMMLAGLLAPSSVGRAAAAAADSPASPPATGKPAISPATGPAAPGKPAPARALVARARREGLVAADEGINSAKLTDALGSAVSRAAGEAAPSAAFKRLFRPADVVGIKVNCIAGKGLSTHPEVVGLLVRWLQEAGVPGRNIVVWDRSDRELVNGGFRIERAGDGPRVLGINDEWEWKPREWGPNGSCFAKLLVDDLTAMINVGVLKDHELAGVALGMKSWYGAIHNPNKCHDNGCSPYIAHLAAFPLIRDKLRLTVVDGLTGQCHAGPGRSPRWAWPYQGVLASTDPVALDAVGWKTIDDRRKEVGLKTLAEEKRAPRWLAEAAKLGLGEVDLPRIRVEDV